MNLTSRGVSQHSPFNLKLYDCIRPHFAWLTERLKISGQARGIDVEEYTLADQNGLPIGPFLTLGMNVRAGHLPQVRRLGLHQLSVNFYCFTDENAAPNPMSMGVVTGVSLRPSGSTSLKADVYTRNSWEPKADSTVTTNFEQRALMSFGHSASHNAGRLLDALDGLMWVIGDWVAERAPFGTWEELLARFVVELTEARWRGVFTKSDGEKATWEEMQAILLDSQQSAWPVKKKTPITPITDLDFGF